ncbi:uncharacterized protein HD556DRAFT_1441759 [Suillus plorans]|uniref:Uncharacterized protein n=1 Tax=Suillus plorans TaxID=116603 RepID=A0A9P7DJN1_9AGAM|nr:uncharacterized protein HD556DRAFT_1441759 [Suillus plorans]KAG1795924.1 hypothetical protein HD556DRAFT_1441759 [Suillus plorans]KAG1809068.1 hypothetical protein EV424DRAFT_1543217 [Suillus variegatus]KAG1824074.1 hypothetical protein EV424DRAFT_1538263 [Suillus variegatus]
MTNPDTAASYNVPENGYFGPVFTTNELTAALQLIRDQVQESAGSSETEYYGPVFAMSELASALKLIHDQDVMTKAHDGYSLADAPLPSPSLQGCPACIFRTHRQTCYVCRAHISACHASSSRATESMSLTTNTTANDKRQQ